MLKMIRLSDVANWFNCRKQTAFAVLFLIGMHLFLIFVNKQNNCVRNVSMFIDTSPEKCCDQPACEPPSEEMVRSILAVVSEIHL